jgi:hypothetical protein
MQALTLDRGVANGVPCKIVIDLLLGFWMEAGFKWFFDDYAAPH